MAKDEYVEFKWYHTLIIIIIGVLWIGFSSTVTTDEYLTTDDIEDAIERISQDANSTISEYDYANKELGFKLSGIDGWYETEFSDQTLGEGVIFEVPPEEEFANIVIIVVDLSEYSISLNEYNEFAIEQTSMVFDNFKVLENIDTTLGGTKSKKIVYTGENPYGYSLKAFNIVAIKNDKAYSLAYTSDVELYQQYLAVAEKVVASFEII